MACGIEAKRERRLSLAAHGSARTRRTTWRRGSRRDHRNQLGWLGLLNLRNTDFLIGGFENLGGLIHLVFFGLVDAI